MSRVSASSSTGGSTTITGVVSTNLTEVDGAGIALGQTTSANSIPVVIANDQSPIAVTLSGSSSSQVPVLVYNAESSVAVGVTTTIVTYTAPAAPTVSYLLNVGVAGTNVGQWTVTNSSMGVYDQKYTSAAELNEFFDFKTGSFIAPGQVIGAGNTITVAVNQAGVSAGNFNAKIQVLQVG